MTSHAIANNPVPAIELKSMAVPGDHPFADIARAFVTEGGLPVEKIETEDEKAVQWKFGVEGSEGTYHFFISLYKADGEIFCWAESAVAMIDKKQELEILHWLNTYEYDLHVPFRIAVNAEGIITIQFRVYADGITAAHWRLRLESLVQISDSLMFELKNRFGLKPYLKK